MFHHPPAYNRKTGFTVIELLVCIGVIGLLAAISLPAVQRSRESVRRVDCASHLRQIGTAAHNYCSAFGVFPISASNTMRPILGFVDQNPLAEQLAGPPEQWVFNVPLFVCPSDPVPVIALGMVSYRFNEGSSFRPNGITWPLRISKLMPRPEDITNGLSNSAMMSERLLTPSNWEISTTITQPARFYWYISQAQPASLDAFTQQCLYSRTSVSGYNDADPALQISKGYNHFLTPNRVGCVNSQAVLAGGPPPPAEYAAPATSLHLGGVNLLYADGSVRFESESIDLQVWRKIGACYDSGL